MNEPFDILLTKTKAELLSLVNSKLDMGIPISVMDLLIEDISNQIKVQLLKALAINNANEEVKTDEQKVESAENEGGDENEGN